MQNELAGKVALVTGGARNIGRAISLALAQGGAAVLVNARESKAAAEETVSMIRAAGGKAALHLALPGPSRRWRRPQWASSAASISWSTTRR
jgi:NAD(P)-dependent dehydrogenase (short-subunit alcohol dehydrogenase family)